MGVKKFAYILIVVVFFFVVSFYSYYVSDDDSLRPIEETVSPQPPISDSLNSANGTLPPLKYQTTSTTPQPATIKDFYLPISLGLKIPLEPVKLTGVNSSDIYLSILSMPKYHRTRLAVLLFTWTQAVRPDQVQIITEESDDEWITKAASLGYHVVPSRCPNAKAHDVLMMCCKSGRQFEEYYLARKAGKMYNWYCHADDDIYVNIVGLTQLLRSHDPNQKLYIGQWIDLGFRSRITTLGKGLLDFPERKRNDFRYVSGNAYCISDALMTELEKYLSGERFVDSCRTAKAEMDDVMVGIAVEGILGYDLVQAGSMKTELEYNYGRFNENDLKGFSTVSLGRVVVPNPRFSNDEDTTRFLSYHCLLFPNVSWCRRDIA